MVSNKEHQVKQNISIINTQFTIDS